MKYNESEEMYLETVLLLQNKNGYARCVDISTELGYSKASVSRAMKCLLSKDYITIGKHNEIRLTDSGLAQAKKVYETHHVIMDLLMRIGADEKLAEENACRIEHVVSDEMLEIIANYLKAN